MPSGAEIANAYIALTVKAPNIQNDIKTELGRVDTDKMGDELGRGTGRGFSKGFAAMAGVVGGATAAIANAAIGSIAGLISEASAAADAAIKFKSTLDFAGVDTKTIDALSKSTKAYADSTVYDLATVQGTTAQLASNGVKDYAKLTEAAGNLNAIAGGNAETFKSVGMVLTQTAGQGKLTAENFNQIADAIPGASGKIQESLAAAGAYTGNFRDAMAAGEITAEEFNAAIMQLGTEPIAVEAAKSTETFEGALGSLQASAVSVIATIMEKLRPAFTTIIGIIAGAVDWIGQNINWLGPLAAGIGIVATAVGIWTAAQWLLNAALTANPIGIVIVAIGALVGGIIWLATQTTFFQDVWKNVTTAIGTAATWLWENILSPVFTAIGGIFTWIWENIINPIGTLIVNYFRFWAAVALWLWENVLQPVFAAIGAVFEWVWKTIIEPIIGFISLALQGLGIVFQWLYDNVIKPVWDGISQTISTVWNWIDTNVFTPFKIGIDLIGQAFQNVAEAIGIAWDGIKAAAATPINFVLDTVWNKGLRSFWNDMVGTLGLNDMKLPEAPLVSFANGTENHVAQIAQAGAWRLWAEPETGGEAYIPLSSSKRGRSTAILADVAQRFGYGLTAYGDGGFFGDVWKNVQNAAAVAGDFLGDPVGAIQKHIIDGIIKPLMSGQNLFGQTVAGIAGNTIKALADSLKSAFPTVSGGPTLARVQAMLPGNLGISSTYRTPPENAAAGGSPTSLHMDRANPAVDIVGSVAAMNAFALHLASIGGWRELLYNNVTAPGIRAYPGHNNHIHVAKDGGVFPRLYDEGGWIPHGGMALNLSGRPEAVLTPAESQALRRGIRGNVTQNIYLQNEDPRLAARQLARETDRAFASR